MYKTVNSGYVNCLMLPFPSAVRLPPYEIRFYEPDEKRFPAIRIARDVMKKRGAYPAVLVGADEVAVDMFLKGRIAFTDIASLVEETLSAWDMSEPRSLDDMIECVALARRRAAELFRRFTI